MKKRFALVALVLASMLVGMSSCSKDTEKCWKTETTALGITVTSYIWGTENQMEANKKSAEVGGIATMTYKSVSDAKTAADCTAMNVDL